MTAASPAAGVAPATGVRAPRKLTTLARLRLFIVAIFALALLLFSVGEGTLARARSSTKTIGKDTAPSIIAAETIASGLAEIDANAANYILGSMAHKAAAEKAIEDRRIEVTHALVHAANNITYEDEKAPITRMFDGFGRYLELWAEARLRHDAGDQKGAVDAYGRATDLMHRDILTAATDLDGVNRRFMDVDYKHQRSTTAGSEEIAAGIGVALSLLLIYVQLFLLRKMRRFVNPALLAATVVAVGFTIYLVQAMSTAREDLRIAKDDAFESIHVLWRARAIAFDARGDESRYLLVDPPAPSKLLEAENAYLGKLRLLTSRKQPTEVEIQAMRPGQPQFEGLLADEISNITFAGEFEAATQVVRELGKFSALDAKMRGLLKGGKREAAVELCIGGGDDEATAAFGRFDQALHEVVRINDAELDKAIDRAEIALGRAEWLVPAAAAAIALLGFLGLRPRLREYAG